MVNKQHLIFIFLVMLIVTIPFSYALPLLDLDGGQTSDFLYTGKEKDKETGLYYYGARYYDTDLMTFITPEQDIPNLYNPQDLNHYTYVRNNPYKYVDPNGEFVDTALDVAFIVSDVAILIDDPSTDNAIALGLDVAGAVIPFVTGVGKIYKIGKAIDKAKDVAQVSEKVKAVSKAVDKTGDVAKSGEKASNIGRATAKSREISFSERQLQSKYKHASDFGIEGNYNKENAQRYKHALENFVSSKDTQVIQGTYRGEKGTHFYNEKTGRYIFRDAKGEFRTGFRLGEKQRKSLRTIGS